MGARARSRCFLLTLGQHIFAGTRREVASPHGRYPVAGSGDPAVKLRHQRSDPGRDRHHVDATSSDWVTKTAPPKKACGYFNLATPVRSKPETGRLTGCGAELCQQPDAHGAIGLQAWQSRSKSERGLISARGRAEVRVWPIRAAIAEGRRRRPAHRCPVADCLCSRTNCSRIIPRHVRSLAVILFSRAVVMDTSGGQAP